MTRDRADTVATESFAMKGLRGLGLKRLAWSVRRLHCPVPPDALVLEVGSGGNPYARANVLLDAFEDTVERYHQPLVNDRPLVYGLIERMPFRTGIFDFVIASHVLEHTSDPVSFLAELQRVALAGYIETPDAFFERINPWRFHRLEITTDGPRLVIRKKASWLQDPDVVTLYENKVKRDARFRRLLTHYPDAFYVRHYWRSRIDYTILNPEVDCGWPHPEGLASDPHRLPLADSPSRARLRQLARTLLSQGQRNRTLDLLALLRCPTCFSDHLRGSREEIRCEDCSVIYAVRDGVPVMFPVSPPANRQTPVGPA
jgi:uncharacterized protein YbaR (Trm112 family)